MSSPSEQPAAELDYEQLLAEVPGEMLLVFDPEFTMVAANRLWYEQTGMTPADIVGRNVFDVFPENPEDVDAEGIGNMKASLHRVLRDRVTDSMPIHQYDIPDGQGGFIEKYWAVTHTPILDENGQVQLIWNRGADVTDFMVRQKKRAEDADPDEEDLPLVVAKQYRAASAASRQLKEQLAELPILEEKAEAAARRLTSAREQLAAVVSSAAEAIITISATGEVVSANETAASLFGYDASSLIGQQVDQLIESLSSGELLQLISEQDSGDPHSTVGRWETEARRSNGKPFPVDLSVARFEEDGTRLLALNVRDRTDQLRRLNEVIRSNRDLERFAYLASHDLQTPARSVVDLVRALKEDLPEAALTTENSVFLDVLEDTAQRMRAQIEGLLQLSRLRQDGDDFELTSLTNIVNEAVTRGEAAVADSNADVSVEELGDVWGDADQLCLLADCLLGNSLKYRSPDRTPQIRFELGPNSDAETAHLVVIDNGIGIPEQQRERVFDIFHRLHPPSESRYPGAGVGLALARRIVEQHKGAIAVGKNHSDVGTRFDIRLPRESSELEE